uniref:Uncharacterized protein n=1 Tax=Rhipicephalus zambeziensis TaxID=60191 RepID=A0A224Y598_9ACAR
MFLGPLGAMYTYIHIKKKKKKKVVIILSRPAKKCSATVFRSYHLVQTNSSLSRESFSFLFFLFVRIVESVFDSELMTKLFLTPVDRHYHIPAYCVHIW